MDHVRLGLIGLGNMGQFHARYLCAGRISRAELVAVSDADPARLACFPGLHAFACSEDLIASGLVDAVLIATPHYFHTTIGIDALAHGLHVLVEKPISVHKADAERLLAAHTNPELVFAAMLQARTDPAYRRLQGLLAAGELGALQRIQWTITDWFRTEAYYASSAWRATWRGEGGGVLLNQCPHQLDLLQWLFGMPVRVHAFGALGKYHHIEVEDEVTAYLEFANGASGVFITSTGEAPGINRLEVAGDRGRIILEGRRIHFTRNEAPAREFCATCREAFGRPAVWEAEVPVPPGSGQPTEITQNFVDAILDGVPLIAPAAEGVRAVELANAMLYSALQRQTVELPLDGAAYEQMLNRLIAQSTFQKKVDGTVIADISRSFR